MSATGKKQKNTRFRAFATRAKKHEWIHTGERPLLANTVTKNSFNQENYKFTHGWKLLCL